MLYAIVAVIILIIDQAVKFWVSSGLDVGETASFIPGFVQLTNVHNTGAAFSLLSGAGARWFFVILTIVVAIGAVVLLSKNIIKGKLGRWMLVMVIAGGLGNCIDRLFNGYVVDMFQFQFKIFGQDFAIFNVADIFITVCGIIFCLYLIFHKEPEEEFVPERAPVRTMPRSTDRPVRADYITQLKRPVVEGRKNIEAEIAAKTIEASPFRKDEVTITDWNMPDFESDAVRVPAATAPVQKLEVPTPAKSVAPAPAKAEPVPESKLVGFEEFFKEPSTPAKKKDSDFSIDDIIAEFKDK